MGQEELREYRLVPRACYPFRNEVTVYDDKVAILSYLDQVGAVIQSESFAETQRAIFNLGFEYAKVLEENILRPADREYLNS